jgi:hypothetical protein
MNKTEDIETSRARYKMLVDQEWMDFQYLTLLEIIFPDRMDKENKNRLQFLRKKIEGEKNVQD